jgi:tetratricopeptide (TPR) repeat protein
MKPVRITQLLLRRPGRSVEPGTGTYERAVTLGHDGDPAGMRRLLARWALAADPGADPEKLFRALLELGLYARAFALAETLLDRPGTDRLVIKDPFIDIRFAPPRGYYEAHLAALSRLRAAGNAARWKNYYAGVLLRRLNRLPEALRAFGLAAPKSRRYGWMRYQRGWTVLNSGGSPGESARDLGAAVLSDPSDWTARCLLGEALLCSGKSREGFAHFSAALKAAPAQLADITAWRGQLRLITGDYRGAEADLTAALKAGGLFAYCWLGAARLRLGRRAGALKLLARAVRLIPGDYEARLWYCEALRLAGRTAEAERQLAHAGDGNWARANKALLLARAGRYREAYGWYMKLDEGIRLGLEKKSGRGPVDADGLAALLDLLFALAPGNRTDKVYLYPRLFSRR